MFTVYINLVSIVCVKLFRDSRLIKELHIVIHHF